MSKRFRVGLSFAGATKRTFVADVAALLAGALGRDRILFDDFHSAEFARNRLAFHLPKLYRTQTDLVVVVFCPDYEKSGWCTVEWTAIYSLYMGRKDDDVMLCRFERVQPEGLETAGFLELDRLEPADVARHILERLALNQGLPRDHYQSPAASAPDTDQGWPDQAPPLDWPVADHTDAQRAFAELITSGATFRILPISGGSETGKTHLTKQFLRNALKIPGLTRGRFDFKGSSDMDAEVAGFAEQLKVALPKRDANTRPSLSTQLAEIFGLLQKAARPTLLIFDTFEKAGEAERWVKHNLLLAAVSEKWLRVIVVGQETTAPEGEPWAGDSSKVIELRPPSPEEWFEFGKPNSDPEFTLAFVRQVHARAKGKSSVLAVVCRPS